MISRRQRSRARDTRLVEETIVVDVAATLSRLEEAVRHYNAARDRLLRVLGQSNPVNGAN